MPCFTTGSAEGDARLDAEESSREATRATRAACDMLRRARRMKVWKEFVGGLSRKTLDWITEHDNTDKERRAQEAEEREQRRLEKKALSKLSKREREILGLK